MGELYHPGRGSVCFLLSKYTTAEGMCVCWGKLRLRCYMMVQVCFIFSRDFGRYLARYANCFAFTAPRLFLPTTTDTSAMNQHGSFAFIPRGDWCKILTLPTMITLHSIVATATLKKSMFTKKGKPMNIISSCQQA